VRHAPSAVGVGAPKPFVSGGRTARFGANGVLLCFTASSTIIRVTRSWWVLAGLLVAGALSLGCNSLPSATPGSAPSPAAAGALGVLVTSVRATLLPYNPALSTHGIPAEQVNFKVSRIPVSSATSSFRCDIEVFRSGRQVGATAVSTGAPSGYSTSSQSVSVEVTGSNFAGQASDAHVVCRVS
jgi:hypothetical protein